MTPFEYDENPFDGWDVDGDISNTSDWDGDGNPGGNNDTGGIVWGCERPELLITETLAWHDRRTEDLSSPAGKYDDGTGPGSGPDTHFDQRYMPQSAFFVELYNPSSLSALSPAEFYDAPQQLALDLKVGDSPVWRMLIVKNVAANADKDPDDPDPATRTPNTDIERSIYLTDNSGMDFWTPEDTGATRFYTSQAVGSVAPGGYAVVGSSGIESGRNLLQLRGPSAESESDRSSARTNSWHNSARCSKARSR